MNNSHISIVGGCLLALSLLMAKSASADCGYMEKSALKNTLIYPPAELP